MMIRVPVLAPGRNLEGTKPPDVHAGVVASLFGMSQVRQTIDEALHMQRIDEADCAKPKETHPAEAEQESGKDGENKDGSFQFAPRRVHATGKFGSPAILVGRLRLIKPAQVRPPKAPLLRARDVFRCVRHGMTQSMVRNPARGMARAIKYRPKNQRLFDKFVCFERFVGEHAVIAHRRAEPAERDKQERQAKNFEARQWEQNQSHDRQHMNDYEVREHPFLAMHWFPNWAFPGMCFLYDSWFHDLSGDLLS